MSMEIRGPLQLSAAREDIVLSTADELTLVGELALPESAQPVATLVTLHPLPTAGGFMDSHILRKAAARLSQRPWNSSVKEICRARGCLAGRSVPNSH